MSITDELRKYVQSWRETPNLMDDLDAGDIDGLLGDFEHIADRIDAEHEKALDEWKAKHGQMWLKGYAECHAELLEGNETLASDLEGCGWIRLPKDADGEPIHVGDVLNPPAGCEDYAPLLVMRLTYDGYENEWFFDGEAGGFCGMVGEHMDVAGWTHYHDPTVEDVLREMHAELDEVTALYVGEAIDSDERDRDEARIFAEYAKRLTLAGDAE